MKRRELPQEPSLLRPPREAIPSLLWDELIRTSEVSIQETGSDNDAIKLATAQDKVAPGAERARLRVVWGSELAPLTPEKS